MVTKSTKTNGILLGILFFILLNSVLFFGWNCVTYITRSTLFPSQMIQESIMNMDELISSVKGSNYAELNIDTQKNLWNNMHFYIEWNNSNVSYSDSGLDTFDEFLAKYEKPESNLMLFSWFEESSANAVYNGVSYLTSKDKINDYIVKKGSENLGLYELDNQISKIAFVVKSDLAPSTTLYQSYSTFLSNLNPVKSDSYIFLVSTIALVLLLANKFKQLGIFNDNLAQFTGWFWLEFKLFCLFIILNLTKHNWNFSLLIIFWGAYGFLNELHFFGFNMFEKNSANFLIRMVQNYTLSHGLQKNWPVEFVGLVCVEIFFLITCMTLIYGNGSPYVLLGVLILAFYLLYRYYHKYQSLMKDVDKLVEKVELIREGNYQSAINLGETSILNKTSVSLDRIQEGIQSKVEEQIKSEKMKIELITNVSHDLKTPITSLINYSDLLLKEELVPAYANDYIKIISQKSVRLKNLVQDLFEISKASSGNLVMNMESIEINDLMKQTLAELEEKIMESNLTFKVTYLENMAHIQADGKRLYNVIDNLISNVLKYSLPNTRAYIDLVRKEGHIYIVIKNIANYELNFDPENLLERFVRGDVSRTTEGSGLGLAIARSFVELMGGKITLNTDGDLFKVEIQFSEIEISNEKEVEIEEIK